MSNSLYLKIEDAIAKAVAHLPAEYREHLP